MWHRPSMRPLHDYAQYCHAAAADPSILYTSMMSTNSGTEPIRTSSLTFTKPLSSDSTMMLHSKVCPKASRWCMTPHPVL